MNHGSKLSLILLIPYSTLASETPEPKVPRGVVFIPGRANSAKSGAGLKSQGENSDSKSQTIALKHQNESSADDIMSNISSESSSSAPIAARAAQAESSKAAASAATNSDKSVILGSAYQLYSIPANQKQQEYISGTLSGDNPGKMTEFFSHIVGLITSGKFTSALIKEPNISDHLRRGYVAGGEKLRTISQQHNIKLQQALSIQRKENAEFLLALSALVKGSEIGSAPQKISPETYETMEQELKTNIESQKEFLEKFNKEFEAHRIALQQILEKLIATKNHKK